jgi:hypothetical protein
MMDGLQTVEHYWEDLRGFRVCVRTTLTRSSPGGTAELSPSRPSWTECKFQVNYVMRSIPTGEVS